MARIGIFGAGYVGLVTGACFADLGHEVVVRDVLPERIERLQAGEVPIHEPGLDEVLERCSDRISFTLDVREAVDAADFLYVAVGTPPTYAGDADLSAVWTVVDELPDDARVTIVMKSTVPVGTGEKVRAALDARGIGLDHRLGPHFLRAGIGWGGSCFPKDSLALKQLAANSGYHFHLMNAVIEVNELQKRRVLQKLQRHLGGLRGKSVALLGLAFKPDPDDMREAPSLVLASRLIAEGAEVRGWDPIARPDLQGVELCNSPLEAVTGADAAVIVTEWQELLEFPSEEARQAMRHPLIVDGRNLLDTDEVRALGFAYEGVGRTVSPLDVFPETTEREPETSE